MKHNSSKAFTLIELLVVIAIISLLASLALTTFASARERARHAKVKAELHELRTAMELFRDTHNDYPPGGGLEHCSLCWLIPGFDPWAEGTWQEISNMLVSEGFLSSDILLDPWGTPYGLDENYINGTANCWSFICSVGPNRVGETHCFNTPMGTAVGDDICVWFPDDD